MPSGGEPPRVRVVGRYALGGEIASGGMASVYLGKMRGPVGFTPIVAVKSPHPQYAKDPEFVRMFLDEARLAGRIRHPNIVPVIDVHADESELFLVLEYVHGDALGRLVQETRRAGELPSVAHVSAVLCDALHGLHAAHEAKDERGEALGIVHRDVSPQNILVGVDGVGRVLDFGVAKAAGRVTTTRDGEIKGKFAYMAPEQLRGEVVDRRADVYSASVVLWESLTGERLFRGESDGHTVERVLFGDLSPPSASRPDLSQAVDAVVMRGLSRERTLRFATAKEMALALSAAAPPASATEVGAWVEARAIDELEHRGMLIAAIESAPLAAPPAASPAETATPAAAPLPAAGASSRVKRGALVLGVGLGALLGVGLVGTYGRAGRFDGSPSVSPSSPSPPSAASNAPVMPAPEPVAAPASAVVPGASVSVAPVAARPPPSTSTPSRSTKRSPKVGPAAKAACQRRSPEGDIEFDMECLRAARAAP